MTDIFREIEEELRRDNLLKLWSRYSRHVIAVAVVALVIAGGVVAWRNHEAAQRRAQSLRYASAFTLVQAGKNAQAAEVFRAIAEEGGGYGVLARFEEAELLAKSGNDKGAIALYERIAASTSIDPTYRDLAKMLAAMHQLSGQKISISQAKSLIGRLQPLTVTGNPWRPSALELIAVARLEEGDEKAAREIYQKLAVDPAAPQDLRARAAAMAASLAS